MRDGKLAKGGGRHSKEELVLMFRDSSRNRGKSTLRRAVLAEVCCAAGRRYFSVIML